MNLPNALVRFCLAVTVILAYLILTGFLQTPVPKDPNPIELEHKIKFEFYDLLKENFPWWESAGDASETGE